MSYCECDWDGNRPQFFTVRYVKKAIKDSKHRCEECNGPICKGESYRRVEGKWYDSIDTYCTCHLCLELEEWAKISVPCFCANVGELHKTVQEMVKDVAPNVPGFFYEYGRRMVAIRKRIREHGPRAVC